MRLDSYFTKEEFIKFIEENVSDDDIRMMFKNANLEKDEDNLMQEEYMLENIAKLKELLLYKEIESAEDNTLILKDGTQIEFYLSDYDCCAGAYGDWILSDNFEGCITNVTHKYSEEKECGETQACLKLTIFHNQNEIAQAKCYADDGNGGYYFSVLSVNVKSINGETVDDFELLSV